MAEKGIQAGIGRSHDTKDYAGIVPIVDEYGNLDLIGNARVNFVMYDLPPKPTRKWGRPAKYGNVYPE